MLLMYSTVLDLGKSPHYWDFSRASAESVEGSRGYRRVGNRVLSNMGGAKHRRGVPYLRGYDTDTTPDPPKIQ